MPGVTCKRVWHGGKDTASPLLFKLPAPNQPRTRRGSIALLRFAPRLSRHPLLPAAQAWARPFTDLQPGAFGPARRGGGSRRGRFPRGTARHCPTGDGKGSGGARSVPARGPPLPTASPGPAALGGCSWRLAGTAAGGEQGVCGGPGLLRGPGACGGEGEGQGRAGASGRGAGPGLAGAGGRRGAARSRWVPGAKVRRPRRCWSGGSCFCLGSCSAWRPRVLFWEQPVISRFGPARHGTLPWLLI